MRLTDKLSWEELVEKTTEKVSLPLKKRGFKQEHFFEWMISKKSLGYVFDTNLWLLAFYISEELKSDKDYFTVVSGIEGVGKSTLLAWLCAVVSPSFSLVHVCFEQLDLIKALRNVKSGDSIMLDEGLMFLFSREAMSGGNKIVMKLFSIMRQLNIHIGIAVPNFFNLDTYVREHRVKTLLHASRTGKYTGFGSKGIQHCNKFARAYKNPLGVTYQNGLTWRGYWNETNEYGHKFPVINDIDWKEYKRLKGEHMKEFLNSLEKQINAGESVVERLYVGTKEFSLATGLNQETVVRMIKRGVLKGKKMGSKWLIERAELENDDMLGESA